MAESEDDPERSERPFQFGILEVFVLTGLVAIWLAPLRMAKSTPMVIGFVIVAVPVTWALVARTAHKMTTSACRQTMSGLATVMVAAGFGFTFWLQDRDHIPIAFALTMLPSLWAAFLISHAAVIPVALVTLWLIFRAFMFLFWLWEWMDQFAFSASRTQAPLASLFTLIIGVSSLPIGIAAVINCGGIFAGPDSPNSDTSSISMPCLTNVLFLSVALGVVVCLNYACRGRQQLAPAWLKMLVWGFFCWYAVLLQSALLATRFYIP